jgi:hypothetical protein
MREAEKEYYRVTLPYGKWTTEDGTEVLFNRKYQPIWVKHPDGKVDSAARDWWVSNIVKQEWYYDDSNRPYGDRRLKRTHDSLARCYAALNKFGV